MTCATPLCWNGTARISELIWVEREAKYFCKRGLTRFLKIRSDLPVGQFLHSCHCGATQPGEFPEIRIILPRTAVRVQFTRSRGGSVIFSNCFPKFSPVNRRARVFGAFSSPIATSSFCLSLPSFSQPA